MEDNAPRFLAGPHGRIAYRHHDGEGPAAVWLGGYASDMLGTKAAFLASGAQERGRAFLRFDYTGHGESEGAFEEGTISRWFADAETVISAAAPGPKVLVGSSMGAWIALLYALRHPSELAGLVLVAPAPDFTEKLVYPRFSSEQRTVLEADGVLQTGTSGHPAETFTKGLFADGKKNLILGQKIKLPCPVRVLHGMDDEVVPTRHVLDMAERIEADDLTVTLVSGGDHRLSEPRDLARLAGTLWSLGA